MSESRREFTGGEEPQGLPRRLGRNQNGYFGETIDIQAVLAECAAAATQHCWTVEQIPVAACGSLLALSRPALCPGPQTRRLYLSAGIHGDEPAGPLALLDLLRANRWSGADQLWICPCLNPAGFLLNRRENHSGLDLNRQYLEPQAEEIRAHIRWLERQPRFEACFCLHEDWESHGFYLYELNPDRRPSLASTMIERVKEVCPIDHSEIIEGRRARSGIIRPSVDPRSRPQWPEAFYLLQHKTRLAYTLEAPSDFPLSVRVASLAAAVLGALARLGPHSRESPGALRPRAPT